MAPDRRKADDPGPGQRRSVPKATHIPGALLATVVFAAALYLRKADLGPRLAERLDLQKWLGSCTGHHADGRLQEANSPLQQACFECKDHVSMQLSCIVWPMSKPRG